MRRRWVISVFAAFLALITTVAIVGYLQTLRRQTVGAAPLQTASVVFAKTNIAERTVVRPGALELREVPVAVIHPFAARHLEEVVNRVAVASIVADEQVLLSRLAPPGVNVGLSFTLPKDKRALTIAVNEVIGVAGFLFPGDHVDVIGTFTLNDTSFTKIVLQDVEVVAIAQKVDSKPGEDPHVTTSATLALTPDQAEILAQVDNSGKVRLALRPYGAIGKVSTTGKTVQAVIGLERPSASVSVTRAQPSASKSLGRRSVSQPRGRGSVAPGPAKASGLLDPPLPIARETFQPPAKMRVLGIATTSSGEKVAIILSGGQTYILELGRSFSGLTVVSITDDKVILQHGESTYELSL